ncbi:MAG: cupin domain-containing protein [Candidatus Aminicenantales bacterium]
MSSIRKQKGGGFLAAEVHRATSLVDYQKGAIVSREILNRPSGTITIFAFDEGQQLSEHTAPFDALVIVLDGQAEIRIAGQPHSARRGEMILMPANVPHSVKAIKKFKMILIMVRSSK